MTKSWHEREIQRYEARLRGLPVQLEMGNVEGIRKQLKENNNENNSNNRNSGRDNVRNGSCLLHG